MSYQVVARKWRPKSFRQLVGQEYIIQALVNGLDQNRVHHAFLFTGTRGVGKTTIARILAKCLNCERGVSSTPCGECASCIDIDDGRFVDVLESTQPIAAGWMKPATCWIVWPFLPDPKLRKPVLQFRVPHQ